MLYWELHAHTCSIGNNICSNALKGRNLYICLPAKEPVYNTNHLRPKEWSGAVIYMASF